MDQWQGTTSGTELRRWKRDEHDGLASRVSLFIYTTFNIGVYSTIINRQNSHLVSYGAMSKQPLSLPTSLHIFKNLTSHGYWQTRWYATHSAEEREAMMKKLVGLMENGLVRSAK